MKTIFKGYYRVLPIQTKKPYFWIKVAYIWLGLADVLTERVIYNLISYLTDADDPL